MKAILINAVERKVELINLDEKNILDELYKYINCSLVEVATNVLSNSIPTYRNHVLYIDEEGLLKNPEHFFGFSNSSYENNISILAGNGIIYNENKSLNNNENLEFLMKYISNEIIFFDKEELEIHLNL